MTHTTDFEPDPDNSDADRSAARFVRDPAGGRWFLTVPDQGSSAKVAIHEFWTDGQTDTDFAAMAPEEIKERLLSSRGLDGFGIREISYGSWNSECCRLWVRSSPPPVCLEKLLRG